MKSCFLIGCNDYGNLKVIRKQNAEVRGSRDRVAGNQHLYLFSPLSRWVLLRKLTRVSLLVSAFVTMTRIALPRIRLNSWSSLQWENRSQEKRISTC